MDDAIRTGTAVSDDGDARTLEAELPALRARLVRQARLAVSDDGLAEDLVQETLIVVMEKDGTRRGDASLTTWAMAILKHKVADWYRAPAQRRRVEFDRDDEALGRAIDATYHADGSTAEAIPAWQQPDNSLQRKQMLHALERCFGCLPRMTSRIFVMREWLGFETREICERLGISAANCRTILHRARMGLRSCMQRSWMGIKGRA